MGYTNSPLVVYTKLSPNIYGKRTNAISRITLHCFVGQVSVERGCEVFYPKSRKASCNYVIGTDGRIGLCVEECNASQCSSSRDNDNKAITVECASDVAAPQKMNDKVYASIIDLCVDICKRNGAIRLTWIPDKKTALSYVPKSNELILTVHRWFANKACPGNWLFSRLGEVAEKVTSILNGEDSNPNEDSKYPNVPFQVQVLIDNLNIRQQPTAKSASQGKTGRGVFTIVEVSGDWGLLKSYQKKKNGWIYLGNPNYCNVLKKISK